MTQHENRQTIKTKDTCFCEESFIDRLFLVLKILRSGNCVPLPWLRKTKGPWWIELRENARFPYCDDLLNDGLIIIWGKSR